MRTLECTRRQYRSNNALTTVLICLASKMPPAILFNRAGGFPYFLYFIVKYASCVVDVMLYLHFEICRLCQTHSPLLLKFDSYDVRPWLMEFRLRHHVQL